MLSSSPRWSLLVAAAAVAAASAIGAYDLSRHDWNASRFLRVGEFSPAREFVESDIDDLSVVPGWGHDGQANYVLAVSFPDLADGQDHLDGAQYRARRIVLPALVSWVPAGWPLAYALIVVNLVSIAALAAAMSELAYRRSAPILAGAVVGVTPAVVASLLIDLGDSLALALVAWGVILWRSRSWATLSGRDPTRLAAIALFTAAALTRETALVVPAALALTEALWDGDGALRPRLTSAAMVFLFPLAALLAWIGLLRIWLEGADKSAAQFVLPFTGWNEWGLGTSEVAVAALLVVLSLWAARLLWSVERMWALVVVIDAAILCCVDREVMFNELNLARVTPWVIPWVAIVLTAGLCGSKAPEPPAANDRQPTNTVSMVNSTPRSSVL